jgi:L,D-peptidoglycan transpeptidase YkuD (ErfK/YbiS/YcfS/YnhG family)
LRGPVYPIKRARNAAASTPAHIVVRPRPGNPRQGLLLFAGKAYPCALGRGGISAFKREGDGATPLGRMRVLGGYQRTDRMGRLASPLELKPIGRNDGWCDEPRDRNYNRPVRLPYPASSERMCRDDGLYDICIVLDHNIAVRKRFGGSAIFFHVAKDGLRPTEGCIALPLDVMKKIAPHLSHGAILDVVR